MDPGVRQIWVPILALPFPSCVISGKLFNLKKKKIMDSESEAWVVDLLPLQVIV